MGLWMLLASYVKHESNAMALRIWGPSCTSFGIAYGLFVFRGEIPLLWSLVVGNLVFALGYVGFGWAIAQIFGRRFPIAAAGIAVLVCTLALFFTEVVSGDSSRRILILAALTAFPWSVSIWLCASEWRKRRVPHILAITSFFVAILFVSFSRVAWGVVHRSFGYEGLPTGAGHLVGTYILLISPVLLTVGFFLLCAEQNKEVITRLAETDDLTGVPNRRSVFLVADNRLASAKRHDEVLACVTFDLDRFKRINDRYGHSAGDHTLMHVATLINGMTREEDAFGRLGGDEFVVFLPRTPLPIAEDLAERYRLSICEQPLHYGDAEIPVSTSFGVACSTQGDQSPVDILNRADHALYEAKHHGRNTVRSV